MRLHVITAALAVTAIVGVCVAETFKHTDHYSTGLSRLMARDGAQRQTEPDSVPQARPADAGYHLSLFDRPETAPTVPGAVASVPSAPGRNLTVTFAPSSPSPVEGYAFTGTVTANGAITALIEDKKTGEGVYVRSGDSFQGGVVGEITPTQIAIRLGGRDWTVARNEVFSVVPLDDSAAVAAHSDAAVSSAEEMTELVDLDFAVGDTVDTGFVAADDQASVADVLARVSALASGDQAGQLTFVDGMNLSNVTISFGDSTGVLQIQSNPVQPVPATEDGFLDAKQAQDRALYQNIVLGQRQQEAQAEQMQMRTRVLQELDTDL